MNNTRHAPIYREIALMQVGDCLQRDIPAGSTPGGMRAAISKFRIRHLPGFALRVLPRRGRLFIVRIE